MFCVIIGRDSSVVVGGGSAWLRCDGGSIDRSDSWVAYVIVGSGVEAFGGLGQLGRLTNSRVSIGEVSSCSEELGGDDGSTNRSIGRVLRGLRVVVVGVCGNG